MAEPSYSKYKSTKTRNLKNNGTPYHGKFGYNRNRHLRSYHRNKRRNERYRANKFRKDTIESILFIIAIPAIFLIIYLIHSFTK